jgi:hemolysin III
VYHATRSHAFWLYLDYMPILILVLSACIYLWQRLLNKWRYTLLATLGPLLLYRIFFEFSSLPEKFLISAGYSVLALSILLPAILHCWFKNRKNWYWLALSLGAFVIAISSRQLDNGSVKDFLPMGSHFLWHIFGGISTFFLIQYLYTSDNVLNLEKQQTAKGDRPDYAGKDNFESGFMDNIQ